MGAAFEEAAVPVHAAYDVTRAELRALRAGLPRGIALPPWTYALLALVLAADIAPGFAGGIVATAGYVAASVVAALLVALAAVAWSRPRFGPGRYEVEAARSGLTITRDGARRAFPWRAVRDARDTDAAIVLNVRRWGSFAVPKRAFADGGRALWLVLEDALIGRDGLVLASRPRRLLSNSKR